MKNLSLHLALVGFIFIGLGITYAALPEVAPEDNLTADAWNNMVGDINNFSFDGTGKVGIGVSNPSSTLDIAGYVNLTSPNSHFIMRDSDNMTGFSYIERNNGGFRIGGNDGSTSKIAIFTTDSGEVGMGDSTPDSGLKLDVEGKIGATEYCDENGANCTLAASLGSGGGSTITNVLKLTDDAALGNGDATAYIYGIKDGVGYHNMDYIAYEHAFRGGGSNQEFVRINTIGNVGIGTVTPLEKLSVEGGIAVSGQAALSSDANSILVGDLKGGDGMRNLKLRAGDQNRLTITTAGLIGIGTENPTKNLEIAGTNPKIKLSGNVSSYYPALEFSSVGGSATGQFLMYGDSMLYRFDDHRFQSDGGADYMRITGSGNVGIGTISPGAKLSVIQNQYTNNTPIELGSPESDSLASRQAWIKYFSTISGIGDTSWAAGAVGGGFQFSYLGSRTTLPTNGNIAMHISTNGSVGIGTTGPSEKLHVSGNILATGSITPNSDERLKKDIILVENALEKISQIDGVNYNWINPSEHGDHEYNAGVIAQDIEAVMPELIFISNDEIGTKSVNYNGLDAYMIEAIKELKSQNDELWKQNVDMMKEIELLKNK